ncbi:MAG: hypothetical protein IT431_00110 [Phycisphaerales bacterium]|nr:hypothetical protein [Phycisphaerales bacterium]
MRTLTLTPTPMTGAITAALAAATIGALALPAAPAHAQDDPIVRIVHLGEDAGGFDALAAEFAGRNPGYAVAWYSGAGSLPGEPCTRIAFVQAGGADASVDGATSTRSEVGVGDIVLLRPGEAMEADAPLDLLVYTTPDPLPDDLPAFIRPDWDGHITDTPGGCATETGAYRRVCLTWLKEKGEYNYHALNAHRVRITDSFTHYHPLDGGFDEFYLVQMAQPGARIIVSDQTEKILDPQSVPGAAGLLHAYELRVGDLVYLPRGVVHRGVGGVLAHVITAPGFIPGAEIGVDHCLREINERLGLEGEDALPYNKEASAGPVVR